MIQRILSWFDQQFAPYLELIAMVGGLMTILISMTVFLLIVFVPEASFDMPLAVVLLPGFIGFLGVSLLMLLRLGRLLSRQSK